MPDGKAETEETTPEPWRHETVAANGLRFHCVTAGEGELVLLLHGFPQCWYEWRHQIPVLAEHFRVVAPDQRGYNESDKPSHVRDYSLEHLSRDTVELVRALGYEKAHVVGHDWGAVVAWTVAREYPEVVDKLVCLNVPEPRQFAEHFRKNFRQIRRSWYMFFFQLPWIPERLLLRRDAAIARRVFRGESVRKDAFNEEDLEVFRRAWKQPRAMRSMLNWYRAAFREGFLLRRPDADPRKIEAPTLVIWGENDTALGKELTYGMEKWISGPYRIHYVPDCGHFVVEEQPELVNRLILDFLREEAR